MGVQFAPVEVRDVEGDHDGARDQKPHEVGEHQTAEEEQEGGTRAALGVVERLGQHHQSEEVGAEAESAEHGREVRRGDGVVVSERRAVVGEAQRNRFVRSDGVAGGERWNHDDGRVVYTGG